MLKRSSKKSILLGAVLLIAAVYLLGTRPRLVDIQGNTMGTTYSISYTSSLFSTSSDEVKQQVDQLLESVNDSMSTYRPESELMRFNRSELGKPFKASNGLIEVIELSQSISRLSDGAYDVTVGPLVSVWGFGPKNSNANSAETAESKASEPETTKKETSEDKVKAPEFITWMLDHYPAELPSEAEIAEAKSRVNYKAVVVNAEEGTLTRTQDVYVDLSSIAKGYGVDQVASLLGSLGINDYMVEIGGEVKVSGFKPGGSLWRLGVRGPGNTGREPAIIVSLTDKALATSGDYLNFYEVDGNKYSHTINPKTGHPEMGRLAEVAVISDTVAKADALATMFMVLGDEEGLRLANKEGIAAYFTYHSGKGFEFSSSNAFKTYLK